MKAGDAFRLPNRFDIPHIFVVISDPEQPPDRFFPDHVFIVMLSTKESYKEDVCTLRKGDYKHLTHDTIAVYEIPPARFVEVDKLQALKKRGVLIELEPVSSDVLKQLRDGYPQSRHYKDSVLQFLFRQGCID